MSQYLGGSTVSPRASWVFESSYFANKKSTVAVIVDY